MKSRLLVLFFILCSFFAFFFDASAFSIGFGSSSGGGGRPDINCVGLPGCSGSDVVKVSTSNNKAIGVISRIIAEMIKYTSVLAVIALMGAGILYLLSGGEEEKIKKAKKWIIWSLLGVVVSVSAWFVVNIINNLSIF